MSLCSQQSQAITLSMLTILHPDSISIDILDYFLVKELYKYTVYKNIKAAKSTAHNCIALFFNKYFIV